MVVAISEVIVPVYSIRDVTDFMMVAEEYDQNVRKNCREALNRVSAEGKVCTGLNVVTGHIQTVLEISMQKLMVDILLSTNTVKP